MPLKAAETAAGGARPSPCSAAPQQRSSCSSTAAMLQLGRSASCCCMSSTSRVMQPLAWLLLAAPEPAAAVLPAAFLLAAPLPRRAGCGASLTTCTVISCSLAASHCSRTNASTRGSQAAGCEMPRRRSSAKLWPRLPSAQARSPACCCALASTAHLRQKSASRAALSCRWAADHAWVLVQQRQREHARAGQHQSKKCALLQCAPAHPPRRVDCPLRVSAVPLQPQPLQRAAQALLLRGAARRAGPSPR